MRLVGWTGWRIGRIGHGAARIRWTLGWRSGWWSCVGCIRVGGGSAALPARQEGWQPLPSRAAISRALVRLGLVRRQARRAGRRAYRRWERGRAMELWQLDVMGGVLWMTATS